MSKKVSDDEKTWRKKEIFMEEALAPYWCKHFSIFIFQSFKEKKLKVEFSCFSFLEIATLGIINHVNGKENIFPLG